jgi:uncharacterized membrane protein YdbT with pleckstrin-like domain
MKQYYLPGGDEKTLRSFHQHVFILIGSLMVGLLMLIIGLIALWVWPILSLPVDVPSIYLYIVSLLYFSIASLTLWIGWFLYSRTEVIITSNLLIDVSQNSLFSRNVAQLELHRVQDVTVERKGVIRTIFNYGNVVIQTAGEKDYFVLQNLSHPNEVASDLMTLFQQHTTAPGAPTSL